MTRKKTTGKPETGNLEHNALANGRKDPIQDRDQKKKLEKYRTYLADRDFDTVKKTFEESPQDFPIMVRLLEDPDRAIRQFATWALYNAANKGVDISEAMPALVTMLGDDDLITKRNASRALDIAVENGADINIMTPGLINLLSMQISEVRVIAALALGNNVLKGADITEAMPALVKALGDENANVQYAATRTIYRAAEKGVDISIAISALKTNDAHNRVDCQFKNTLNGGYSTKNFALLALEIAALDKQSQDKVLNSLLNSLGDEYRFVQLNAVGALLAAAKKDHETRVKITKAIMELMNSDRFRGEADRNSGQYIHTFTHLKRITQELEKAA
jgi:HEAT repeat protein